MTRPPRMQEARAAYAHTYRVKRLEEQADAWHQTDLTRPGAPARTAT
ncbi:hypothetical protein [Streptomyces sp. NBC_00893]|nr:hypothetical protein [Streptomyces sp. NBC_00893]MCX4844629.1 hypothetical protein [Streptomyces sp. NBC_00893]